MQNNIIFWLNLRGGGRGGGVKVDPAKKKAPVYLKKKTKWTAPLTTFLK